MPLENFPAVFYYGGFNMNINWFQDPDHLVYINAEKSLGELEKRLKLPGLCEAANALHAEPNDVG